MTLTSNDETDLLLPLFRGTEELPRFATFLGRLKRRTGATHVALVLEGETPDAPSALIVPDRHLGGQLLRPFRVYALSELAELDSMASIRKSLLRERHGLADARIVRVASASENRGWLLIARDRPCSASDSALLSSLAPYVRAVLDAWHAMQRERAHVLLSSLGLGRVGAGWILFDADARMLAIEPGLRDRLSDVTGAVPAEGERLRGMIPAGERRLGDAASRFGEDCASAADQAVLLADPRCDAVLCAIEAESDIRRQFPAAAMIAWCRIEASATGNRAQALAGLYELPAREAELAVALADGHSISQAAARMGLTIETARNYSKRVYAKLSVSGQAQLVSLVHSSGAALA